MNTCKTRCSDNACKSTERRALFARKLAASHQAQNQNRARYTEKLCPPELEVTPPRIRGTHPENYWLPPELEVPPE